VDLTPEQLLDESIALSAAGNPLDPQVLKSVAGVIEQRVSREEGPADPYTAYSNLLEMARDPVTRPAFLSLDLSKVADTLLPDQYNKLVANQEKGAWGFTPDTTKRVDRALAKLKLPNTTSAGSFDEEDWAKAEQFRAVAENALMQAEHREGRPLTGKETQDTIDALFDEVVIDVDFIWDDVVRLYEVTQETEIGLHVPAKEAAEIRQELGLDAPWYQPLEAAADRERVREAYREILIGRQSSGGM
jgi:hypothetical protein